MGDWTALGGNRYYREADGITNVIQHNWGGLATPTEYDVPKCGEGVPQCTLIDGHWVRHPTCKRAGVLTGRALPFTTGWALPLTVFTDCVH